MTIYSTENASNAEKKDLIDDGVTITMVCPEKTGLADLQDVPLDTEYSVYNDPVVPIRRQAKPAQRRMWLQLCLFIGMLTGLTISILASLYLYKSMTVSGLRYRGRCGVGVVEKSKLKNSPIISAPKDIFEEDVDINGNVETISVPKSGDYARANITYDFDKNITAILDLDRKICYLLPILYAELIPSPLSFYENNLNKRDEEDNMNYLEEEILVYTVCSSEECYLGSLGDMAHLCGEYSPRYGQPAFELAGTTTPTTTTESSGLDFDMASLALRKLESMFRAFAGGKAVVNYQIYSSL